MSIQERKLNIALQLANNTTSILIDQLAERDEQIDALKARVAELEPKEKTNP